MKRSPVRATRVRESCVWTIHIVAPGRGHLGNGGRPLTGYCWKRPDASVGFRAASHPHRWRGQSWMPMIWDPTEKRASVASFPPGKRLGSHDRFGGLLQAVGQPTTTSVHHAGGISRPIRWRVTASFRETDIRRLRGDASPFLCRRVIVAPIRPLLRRFSSALSVKQNTARSAIVCYVCVTRFAFVSRRTPRADNRRTADKGSAARSRRGPKGDPLGRDLPKAGSPCRRLNSPLHRGVRLPSPAAGFRAPYLPTNAPRQSPPRADPFTSDTVMSSSHRPEARRSPRPRVRLRLPPRAVRDAFPSPLATSHDTTAVASFAQRRVIGPTCEAP